MGKSLLLTYFYWLVGGWFGLHHIYLGRDRHAFLTWSLAAGYFGTSLIRDLWRIPDYVRDANNDPKYLKELTKKMRNNHKPPYSFVHQIGQFIAGNVWGYAIQFAIPVEPVLGWRLHFLSVFIPVGIALGVHTVGNVGHQRGSLFWPLIGAYMLFLVKYVDLDGIPLAAFISSSFFEAKSSQWQRKPRVPKKPCWRFSVLAVCALAYSSLWVSYLYFNAEVTDSTGETIKLRDAVVNFFTSPLWRDLKQHLLSLMKKLWSQGWYATWRQLMNDLDPLGEQQALEVLGLDSSASQEDITAQWRKLSKEWHPDRYLDAVKKAQAQEKFMEFNAAYENLSKIKSRRAKRNKKFQDY